MPGFVFGGSTVAALTPSVGDRGLTKEVWIALRDDGRAGTGTAEDPFDGSTHTKFDALMAGFGTYTTIHLEPGTFETNGWPAFDVKTGWRILGAGRDLTTIKLVHATDTYNKVIGVTDLGTQGDDIEYADFTVDCNFDALHAATNTHSNFEIAAVEGRSGQIRNVHAIHFGGVNETFVIILAAYGPVDEQATAPNSSQIINCKASLPTTIAGFASATAISIQSGYFTSASIPNQDTVPFGGSAEIIDCVVDGGIYGTAAAPLIGIAYQVGGFNAPTVKGCYARNVHYGYFHDTFPTIGNRIVHNIFDGCGSGILMNGGGANVNAYGIISDNVLTCFDSGFGLDNCNHFTVENNTLRPVPGCTLSPFAALIFQNYNSDSGVDTTANIYRNNRIHPDYVNAQVGVGYAATGDPLLINNRYFDGSEIASVPDTAAATVDNLKAARINFTESGTGWYRIFARNNVSSGTFTIQHAGNTSQVLDMQISFGILGYFDSGGPIGHITLLRNAASPNTGQLSLDQIRISREKIGSDYFGYLDAHIVNDHTDTHDWQITYEPTGSLIADGFGGGFLNPPTGSAVAGDHDSLVYSVVQGKTGSTSDQGDPTAAVMATFNTTDTSLSHYIDLTSNGATKGQIGFANAGNNYRAFFKGTGNGSIYFEGDLTYINSGFVAGTTGIGIEGDLLVTGFMQQPAGSYYNFGATQGTGGYGLHESGGNVQFKHSGGSWATLGTVASKDTGTSGATIPLLNGTNTWSGAQTFATNIGFYATSPVTQQSGNAATALANYGLILSATWPVASVTGLGTAATVNTGTSAGNVPILDGSGKIVSAVLPATASSYKGVWNANTNSPSLSDGSGTNGDYYFVSVAGSTSLDGISSWAVGDTVVSNSTPVWQRVPSSSPVTSVAGRTGAIALANTDISGLGTSSTVNTGTSGAVIPLLDGTNVWSGAQTFGTNVGFYAATPVAQQSGNAVTALANYGLVLSATWPTTSITGLGTAATVNTGISGATIPLLNGTNVWSGAQTFGTNVGFYATTPVAQQSGNAVTALANYGLVLSATWPVASVTGLGTAATVNTGSSGAVIPLLNGTNVWSGAQSGATATTDTSTTQFATTAFVIGQAGGAMPIVDSVSTEGTSKHYARADHIHPSDTSLQPISVVTSVAYASTITPAVGTTGALVTYNIAALTGALTVNAPTGTPLDGQTLKFRFVQDGTGRVITWNAAFAFGTDITAAMIPTTASAKFEVAFQWNATDSKWRAIGLIRGF